jgi:hypothetical protein
MTVDEFKQAYQNSPKAISIASQLKTEGEKITPERVDWIVCGLVYQCGDAQ